MFDFIPVKDEGFDGVNPVQFGFETCKKSHDYGPATRYHWLIHYIVSGSGIFVRDSKEYVVNEGEMFVIPPWEITYYKADSRNPWSYIWIGFTSKKELPVKLEPVIRCPEALTIFTAMKKCQEKSGGRSAWLCAKIWELFSILQEGKNERRDYIQDAVEIIRLQYANPITAGQIAAELGLERTYFSSLFKKKTGISPKQYLLNYRMNMALKLLTERGESVTVAAYSSGYTDVYNFSKMFKRHFGLSPREYVKRRHSSVDSSLTDA